jgi:hypothetical protein
MNITDTYQRLRGLLHLHPSVGQGTKWLGLYLTKNLRILLLIMWAFLLVPSLQAQWVVQHIPLNPGWNAVYLEIQPEPKLCDAIFENISVVSVWCWNPKTMSAQYITTWIGLLIFPKRPPQRLFSI